MAKPGRSIELLRAHISDGGKLLGLHDLLDVRPRDATPPGSTVEEHLGVAEDAVKSAAEGRYRAAQAATSDRTGEELRSFVAPITPEQHRIIAAASEGHMVIAGPAGSGKSSVAFHRLAYHAAPDRGEKRLDMSDVLVRSPSDTYRNYAIPVFRSLGVDEPNFDVLEKWSRQCLGSDGERVIVETEVTRRLVQPSPRDKPLLNAAVLGGRSRSDKRAVQLLDRLIVRLWAVDTRGLGRVRVHRELTGLQRDLEIDLRAEIQGLRRKAHLPIAVRRERLVQAATSKTTDTSRGRAEDIAPAKMRKLLRFGPLPTG